MILILINNNFNLFFKGQCLLNASGDVVKFALEADLSAQLTAGNKSISLPSSN